MIGPIVCSAALALGGICGVLFGSRVPKRVKETLPLVFGVVTIGIGTTLVGKSSALHVVVLALIIGTFLGELCCVELGLEKAIRASMKWSRGHNHALNDTFIIQFITLISVFCFSSMGIFGAITEGVTGKSDILLVKSVLDFFSGIIFGAVLGIRVSLIAVPQFLVLAGLYLAAPFLMHFATPAMLNDFSSCGGVILLATGLRMCGIKIFPVVNMLPSLAVVLPISYLLQMIL